MRRIPRSAAVWLWISLLGAAAAAVFATGVHGRAPLVAPHLDWWAVAVGFLVAEICVVHIQFRRSAHSFSLADVPFVFGLAFAGGDAFVLGALAGAGAA